LSDAVARLVPRAVTRPADGHPTEVPPPAPDLARLSTVFARWSEIVGAEIAAHVMPLALERDTLVLGADHPAWATRARLSAPDTLAAIAAAGLPAPRTIRVVVRPPGGGDSGPTSHPVG
jgi:hypothetical protein